MKKKSPNIKWSLVDLTGPATELAQELGVHVNAVYNARRRLDIEAPNLAGGARPGAGAPIGNTNGQGNEGRCKEDAQVQYQIRIRPSLLEQAKEEAKKHRIPVSELIRLALVS
jgi:hypothetical protein